MENIVHMSMYSDGCKKTVFLSVRLCKNYVSGENFLPDDAPGASPCRWGTSVAIMLYYPDWNFSVLQRNMHFQHEAPPGSIFISEGMREYFCGFSSNFFLQKFVQK